MDSASTYRYEKYSFKIITPLLILLALGFLFNGGYIGGCVAFTLGTLTAFSYQGVVIDPEQQRYMKYDRFLNFRIGGWKALSTPSYVTVVRINVSSTRNSPLPFGIPQDQKDVRAFKVNLVVEDDSRYISICRGSREKMIGEALQIGDILQIKVLDYTTHEKRWIK